jgi:hypothetical protein
MIKMIREGRALYNWESYAAAFGWVSMEKIREPERVAYYISKYVTKGLGKKIQANNHVYYCSQGLTRAVEIRRGNLLKELDPDYMDEHFSIKTVQSLDEAMDYFESEVEPPPDSDVHDE